MSLTMGDIQEKAIKHGFKYWRAPDAHGVDGTVQQAIRLLQDLIGVEVGIGGDENRGCPECSGMGDSIAQLSIEAMHDREEIRRLRIAHLRRMAELAESWGAHMVNENEECIDLHPHYAKTVSDGRRLIRFAEACSREIAKLRGEG